jgi:hypothetical protein
LRPLQLDGTVDGFDVCAPECLAVRGRFTATSTFGNVLWTSHGPRWTDLENACIGPVEYDLSGIAWRAMDGTDHALAAYGPHDRERLQQVTPFLALFLAAWTLDLAKRHPWTRPYAQERPQERLDRVREWLDDSSRAHRAPDDLRPPP